MTASSERSRPATVSDRLAAGGFGAGWKWLPGMPARMAFSMFDDVASAVYIRGGAGVERLRRNYAQARPELGHTELEALVRRGLRSYMRYWCEAFRLPGQSPEQIRAAIRVVGDGPAREALSRGEPLICFVPHMGNWDLVGAWAQLDLGPLVTVAEKVRPESVFEGFMRLRQDRGITVYPLTDGNTVLRRLMTHLDRPDILSLLGDRDLTGGGIEVDFLGGRASFAMGPAVLALRSTGRLVPISIRYEKVERSVTPSGYRTVLTLHDPVVDTGEGRTRDRIAALTQGCADVIGEQIRAHTENWHMMQPVFLDRPIAPDSPASTV